MMDSVQPWCQLEQPRGCSNSCYGPWGTRASYSAVWSDRAPDPPPMGPGGQRTAPAQCAPATPLICPLHPGLEAVWWDQGPYTSSTLTEKAPVQCVCAGEVFEGLPGTDVTALLGVHPCLHQRELEQKPGPGSPSAPGAEIMCEHSRGCVTPIHTQEQRSDPGPGADSVRWGDEFFPRPSDASRGGG